MTDQSRDETDERELHTGTVKWFNLVKGFGFITSKDGQDFFVHQPAVLSPESESSAFDELGKKGELGEWHGADSFDGYVVFSSASLTAIKANGYRSLEEGEKVHFKILDSEKGQIADFVTSTDGGNVTGASRKNRVKKGARKYTSLCFNCNEGGHRARSCPYRKRQERICHKCGSKTHLIRACPILRELLEQFNGPSSADTEQESFISAGSENDGVYIEADPSYQSS